MTRDSAETRIIGKIDREAAKAERSARKAAIEARARDLAASFIGLNDAERADFARALVRECRADLMLTEGPVVAATFLQQQSAEAGKGILLGKIARAHAEQEYAKLTGRGEA